MKIGTCDWKIGRPYIHRPFHPGLPTLRDWMWLLIGSFVLTVGLSHYILVGYCHGWRTGVHEFAAAAWNELSKDRHGQ